MSIVSNEHQSGSPFPPLPPPESLRKIEADTMRADEVTKHDDGTSTWLIGPAGSKRSLGYLEHATESQARQTMRMCALAKNDAANETRREIRKALGID